MTSALVAHLLDYSTAHLDIDAESEVSVDTGNVFYWGGASFYFTEGDVGIVLVRIRNGTNIAIGFLYISANVDVAGNVLGTTYYTAFKLISDPGGLFTQVTFTFDLQGGLPNFQEVTIQVHGHSDGNLLSIRRVSVI